MKNEPENTELTDLPQGETLTRKQRESIPHLVGARSLEAGCRKAKIAKATLYTWMKDESFKTALEAARQDFIKESLERLKAGVSKAVDGILTLAGNKDKWIKLRACEKILDFALRSLELENLLKRIETLEEKIK